MELGIWIELNPRRTDGRRFPAQSHFRKETFSHAVDQFGAIFSLLLPLRVGSFGA